MFSISVLYGEEARYCPKVWAGPMDSSGFLAVFPSDPARYAALSY